MTLPAKLGFGALALGSVGGLGYVGTRYFSSDESDKVVDQPKTNFGKENEVANQGTSISELINKEYNHILLKTTATNDNTYWDTNWTNYKTDSDKLDKDIFGLDGWKRNSQDKLIEKLKSKCEQLAKEVVPDSNNDNYKNVTKYCARNVTIKDQADKEKLAIITEQNAGSSAWDAVAGKKVDLTTHFTNLKIVAASGTTDIKGTDVKKGCTDALSKNKSESDYQTTYDSYKEVCVKK